MRTTIMMKMAERNVTPRMKYMVRRPIMMMRGALKKTVT
jgi:hypothetical protein